jgi:hypothetical protein
MKPPGKPEDQAGAAPGANRAKKKTTLKAVPKGGAPLPVIKLVAGNLDFAVGAGEAALARAGGHFQSYGQIVSIEIDPSSRATSIKVTTEGALLRALSRCARWQRFDKRENAFTNTDPPARHVAALLTSANFKCLPVLRGLTRSPFFREDHKTLVTKAGFDAKSGLFGVFLPRSYKILAKPTRADSEAALIQLQTLLAEFPFATEVDRAAALAAILTAACRPSLQVAPGFLFKAPVSNSGKSYLAKLVAAFAGAGLPAIHALPSTPEEFEKLILATLLEAPECLFFDNLLSDVAPFAKLCQALTEPFVSGRILGQSKTTTTSTRVLVLFTGNNVAPLRDLSRRIVSISIDPRLELPGLRAFKNDPLSLVQREREHFVGLALTVLRGYILAGKPLQTGMKPLPSFDAWSALVRSSLCWLGLPDCAESIFEGTAQDAGREALGRVLSGWFDAFQETPQTVRNAVDFAEKASNKDFFDAILEVATDRNAVSRKRFGRFIARNLMRVVEGKRFERAGRESGSERWVCRGLGVLGVSSPTQTEIGAQKKTGANESVTAKFAGLAETNPRNHQTPPEIPDGEDFEEF